MNIANAYPMQPYTGQNMRQPPTADVIVEKIMNEVDADGDGSISSEELAALDERRQNELAEADTDGDGAISQAELLDTIVERMNMRQEMGVPATADIVSRIMQDADSDGDGVISIEELSAIDERQQQRLAESDADGDGAITEEELTNALSESADTMPPPPPPISMNDFKGMLGSALEGENDTASQVQSYLAELGLDETQIEGLMTLLENSRFDVTA